MEDEKISISVNVLESMLSDLGHHCTSCSLLIKDEDKNEMCYCCHLLDVYKTLSVILSGDVNEWH